MKWNFLQKLFGNTKNEVNNSESAQNEDEHYLSTLDTITILQRAKNKTKSKNYNGALFNINFVLNLEPENIDAFMQRSEVKRKLKDDIGATEDLNHAGLLLKKLDRGLKAYEKGIEKLNSSDYKSAIKYFTDAISANIDTYGAYYYRGLSKRYLGDYRGAIPDYNKAIELNPNYTEVYYDRGKIKYHKLDDSNGALIDFNRAIELNPSDADVYVSRAILKSSIDDDEGAMNDYNKAILLKPTEAQTYFSRAMLKFKPEDFHGAIQDLDKAIELKIPDDASVSMFDAYSLRGNLKYIMKDYEGSIRDFDIALQYEPNDGKVYFERGEARLSLGQNDLAAEDKFMAIKLGYDEK